MFNSKTLEELNELGFGSDVDAFESYFKQLQDAAADGEPLVQDPVYDRYKKILQEIKPGSVLLKGNWEKDSDVALTEYDKLLKEYGMRSIRTCTTDDEIKKAFANVLSKLPIEVCTSCKMNGHACRVVYNEGDLVSATTRGRYKKGRDITRHLRKILGDHNEYLEGYGLVEIRGELLVTFDDFENKLRYSCKTPLSSVTSLVRDSATDEDLKYLHFVAYKMLIDEDDDTFDTLSEEMDTLANIGFETPFRRVSIIKTFDDIKRELRFFESHVENFTNTYDTDGIVMAVNNDSMFYSMGLDGNAFLANIAIKMGHWECNMYSSIIKNIVWEKGKSWFTPKAEIEAVMTANGATVTTVPLYNVGVMNKLKLIPGMPIHFRFGGETGVQLLTPDGMSVTSI